MDVRDYEYIVAIAEQGSITRAAAQLFITQPALTRFLKRTEAVLGLKLFIRNGNQFLLTEAGRRYVETGRAIVQMDRQLSEQLTHELTMQKSRIRLGFPMGRDRDMLENVLPRFVARYPNIQLCLHTDTSRKQMELLRHNDLDLALVTNAEQLPGYVYLPVERSWMAVVVHEDSPLLARSRSLEGYPFPVIPKEALNDAPFVALTTITNSGHIAHELRRKYDIRPNVVMEVNNVRSSIDAVESGYGSTMFMSIPLGSQKIRYLSIGDVEVMMQTAALVYRSDKTLTAPMRYLGDLITQHGDGGAPQTP